MQPGARGNDRTGRQLRIAVVFGRAGLQRYRWPTHRTRRQTQPFGQAAPFYALAITVVMNIGADPMIDGKKRGMHGGIRSTKFKVGTRIRALQNTGLIPGGGKILSMHCSLLE